MDKGESQLLAFLLPLQVLDPHRELRVVYFQLGYPPLPLRDLSQQCPDNRPGFGRLVRMISYVIANTKPRFTTETRMGLQMILPEKNGRLVVDRRPSAFYTLPWAVGSPTVELAAKFLGVKTLTLGKM